MLQVWLGTQDTKQTPWLSRASRNHQPHFPGVFPEVPSVFAACTCRSAPPRSLSCSFASLHIYSRWAPSEGLCKEMNSLPGAGTFSSDFPGRGAAPWGGSCHPHRLWTITICLFSVCSSLCTPVTRWQEPRPQQRDRFPGSDRHPG